MEQLAALAREAEVATLWTETCQQWDDGLITVDEVREKAKVLFHGEQLEVVLAELEVYDLCCV